jgi:hypothetical protein
VWGLGAGFILRLEKLTLQTFFGSGKMRHPAFLATIGV